MREESLSFPPYPTELSGRDETVEVRVISSSGGRVFELTTTAERRDTSVRHRQIAERSADPRVVTGSPLFDALFARVGRKARGLER